MRQNLDNLGKIAGERAGSMTITQRAGGAVAGGLAAVLMLLLGTTPHASAQTVPPRGNLVVTGSASPSPGSSSAIVTYSASIKNDGTFTATGVTVTILMPPNTQFVKCSPSVSGQVCQQAGGVVTTTFASVKAHAIARSASASCPRPTSGRSQRQGGQPDTGHRRREPGTATPMPIIATVVPGSIPVEFLPSLRRATVACGDTVGSDFFQAGETTVRLLSSMGCAQSDLGLRIAASGKTLDLNKFKIVGPSSTPNSKGIVIGTGATNVTVIGGSTNGTSGIESFDYGLFDEGGNTGLWVTSLRCFRARSAGLDIVSDGVTVSNVLVDRTVGGSATQEAPGGVGIHASGNVHIVDSIVRRSAKIGIWVDGSQDLDGNHRIAKIDGTTRVEDNSGIGLLLEGQLHFLKDVDVTGRHPDQRERDRPGRCAGDRFRGPRDRRQWSRGPNIPDQRGRRRPRSVRRRRGQRHAQREQREVGHPGLRGERAGLRAGHQRRRADERERLRRER
jgi:uncharacterized repeat protein (TIGR01451 family)